MSDKLYFLTHAQNSGNNFITKKSVCNLPDTNIDCDSITADETCKRKVN